MNRSSAAPRYTRLRIPHACGDEPRRPTAKNGMAVKTPNYRFMHIIKVYAALADFSVAVARFFRKKTVLKFLFIFREFMAVYDDHDFILLF